MSNDTRKLINPLLNVSVTGGTVEDFSQHALLLPAAAAPPVIQPPAPTPMPMPPPPTDQQNNFSTFNFASYQAPPPSAPYFQPTYDSVPQSQPQLQANYFHPPPPPQPYQSPVLEEYPISQEASVNPEPYGTYTPIQTETQEPFVVQSTPTPPQAGLQSVFSSFSSYLKIGNRPAVEDEPPAPVPSVVDSVLATPTDYPNASPQPVPFYSPDKQFPPTLPPAPAPSTAGGNTYRRGGLKRPTYAPIPGLTSGVPLAAPQIPGNLPSQPPASHSPFTPFVGNPLQSTVSPLPTPPPVVPIPSLPPAQVQQIDRIKENLKTTTSPFLSPVASVEEIELTPIPTLPTSITAPSILTPTSYYPVTTQAHSIHSSLLNPEMSNGDSPRASPSLNTGRMDSTERPILTHNEATFLYRPVYHHWFYKKVSGETKVAWTPFSMHDSLNMETTYLSNDLSPDKLVATDGGRYDVNILSRERVPVYWDGPKTEVRRCSWFHKGSTDGRYVPYEENVATMLEEEFKIAFETSTWNRKVELPNGESVVFHGPDVLVLFPPAHSPDNWGNTPNQPRPRVVKRGLDEFHIDEGESEKIDHLLFLVHGIGKFCDLKFRNVYEAVDEFRNITLQLVQSHYRSSCDKELVNRVEILPINWHDKLHSDENGVDQKLKGITLESIPRLRQFSNDTILDVLFYTSPVYCQKIISTVANELNRIYDLFRKRNPSFTGGVSLGGHSLGSLILFDILCHQHPEQEKTAQEEEVEVPTEEDELTPLKPPPNQRKMARRISYMMAKIGTGHPQIHYPHLSFHPRHFFALGSPVAMFVTVRGLDNLGEQFALPTCPEYFNIFHPYDPVAYRIESLINPELANLKPVLIPHHKGRKRMHLELKETMARVGADLKQKLLDSMKSTWNSFYQFSIFKGPNQTPPDAASLEEEVEKVLEAQLHDGNTSDEDIIVEAEPTDLSLGALNHGRRIDYVLQEAPLEFFNEYIFALTSHVCYWESNDTILLIVKEIYNSKNISADSQIPQQTMKIERTRSTSASTSSSVDEPLPSPPSPMQYGMDPTMPISASTNVGPPPLAGFMRKS